MDRAIECTPEKLPAPASFTEHPTTGGTNDPHDLFYRSCTVSFPGNDLESYHSSVRLFVARTPRVAREFRNTPRPMFVSRKFDSPLIRGISWNFISLETVPEVFSSGAKPRASTRGKKQSQSYCNVNQQNIPVLAEGIRIPSKTINAFSSVRDNRIFAVSRRVTVLTLPRCNCTAHLRRAFEESTSAEPCPHLVPHNTMIDTVCICLFLASFRAPSWHE